MVDGLGDSEPFFGQGEPLRERPAFGVAVAQPGPGGCGDDAIVRQSGSERSSPWRRRHIPFQTRDGLCIVARYRNRPDPG